MTEPVDDRIEALAVDFLTRLGAAMVAANYPINLVRRTLTLAADRYGLANHLLVLPGYIQLGGSDHAAGTTVRVARAERDLRYDQTFPLADLVRRAERGQITAEEGLAELDSIHALPRRFPAWVSVIGYSAQSAGFALILQPTPIALIAATGFGLLVGALALLDRVNAAIGQMLPVICAFLVAFTAFTLGRLLHMGEDSLRVLIPPLALFLPGVAITLAVVELTTREVVSGSARLAAGLMQLAQLALGILIAAQMVGLTASELSVAPVNRFGAWAPWLGVAVYAVGIVLYFGPPARFMPWLMAVLFVAYTAQTLTDVVFGGYASGFGGGLALMLCALVLSQRPKAPPTESLLLPGFWLMVPTSLGLIGVTELVAGERTGAFAVIIASIFPIALGFQAGLLIWGAVRQFRGAVF